MLEPVSQELRSARAELEENPFVARETEWVARVDAVARDVTAIEAIVARVGPHDGFPRELTARFAQLRWIEDRARWSAHEMRLLIGVLRAHGGVPLEAPLEIREDRIVDRDAPMACDTIYDEWAPLTASGSNRRGGPDAP